MTLLDLRKLQVWLVTSFISKFKEVTGASGNFLYVMKVTGDLAYPWVRALVRACTIPGYELGLGI